MVNAQNYLWHVVSPNVICQGLQLKGHLQEASVLQRNEATQDIIIDFLWEKVDIFKMLFHELPRKALSCWKYCNLTSAINKSHNILSHYKPHTSRPRVVLTPFKGTLSC